MDKIWVKDVKEGERLKSVFLVARKAVPTAKSGKAYLSVTLHDKTGELEARAFERVEELSAALGEKDYVEVEGQVGTFQGKPQLRIEQVAKSDPTTVDPVEFVWAPPPEPKKPEKTGFSDQDEAAWKELHAIVDAVTDTHVKALSRPSSRTRTSRRACAARRRRRASTTPIRAGSSSTPSPASSSRTVSPTTIRRSIATSSSRAPSSTTWARSAS